MIQRNRFGEKTSDIIQNLLEGVYLPEAWQPLVYEGFEEVPGRYDVGEIVRGYTDAWINTPPWNHVTPAEMMDLMLFLDDMTSELESVDEEKRRVEVGAPGSGSYYLRPCRKTAPGYRQLCVDLRRWRVRLDEYMMLVGSVPYEQQYDRNAILWEVTAPLFLGWYGGLTGDEVPLVEFGYAPGFNTELRHPPDIATLYSLANQHDVFFAWEQERRKRLHRDLKKPYQSALSRLPLYAAIGVTVYAGWKLITRD